MMNSLLKKEALLQAQIDTLQSEIDELETKVEFQQQQGAAQLSRQELKQIKAPEWCIPIKANVLTFEWDVRMHVCVCVTLSNQLNRNEMLSVWQKQLSLM